MRLPEAQIELRMRLPEAQILRPPEAQNWPHFEAGKKADIPIGNGP